MQRPTTSVPKLLWLGLTCTVLASIAWNILVMVLHHTVTDENGTMVMRSMREHSTLPLSEYFSSSSRHRHQNATVTLQKDDLKSQTETSTIAEDLIVESEEEEESVVEYEMDSGEALVQQQDEEEEVSDLERHLQRRREQHEEAANQIASGDNTDDKQEKKTSEDDNNDDKIAFDFDYDTPVTKTSSLTDPIISDSNLIVMIMSARNNSEHRQVIRETWGSGHTVLFLIGGETLSVLPEKDEKTIQEEEALQHRLTLEQSTHHDLLDTLHPESYKSLPHKLKFAMHWIHTNVKQYNWVMKADDDIFVRVKSLETMILSIFQPETPMVVGNIARRASVLRKGKWAELKYHKRVYPTFALGGSGYIVSRNIVKYIATTYENEKNTKAQILPVYQGEDTSLGIWLSNSQLDVFWIHSPYFVLDGDGDCRAAASPMQDVERVNPLQRKQSPGFFLSIGHHISPALMKVCYETGDEWKWRFDRNYAVFTRQQGREAAAYLRGGKLGPGDKSEFVRRGGILEQLDVARAHAQKQQAIKRVAREERRQDVRRKQLNVP